MNVRLLGQTTGIIGTEYEGKSLDEIIVGIARISSSREVNDLFNEPEKLIRYCILNGHWSIFDTVNIIFDITTSRAIGRELLRHSSIKPQEISQRYAKINACEEIELRKKSISNRQSSTDLLNDVEKQFLVDKHVDNTVELYNSLLDNGVARETARMILPEAMQTRIIMNGTVRQWITFLNQRLHKTSQKEMREVANGIKDIFTNICPIISKALDNFVDAEEIHILDKMVLTKYKVFDKINK